MNFTLLRQRMVKEQLIARGIEDPRLLAAFSEVPRHLFLPKDQQDRSYSDRPLPIGEGQTISQPYMVAVMLNELEVLPGDRVLEIGTGSGYETALLAYLGAHVFSIERLAVLAERARALLQKLSIPHVQIRVGDGSLGWLEEVPFEGVVVTAAAPAIPQALAAQLKEGGRLVIPIGSALTQILTVVERHQEEFITRQGCGCAFVPLIGTYGWKEEEASS